MAALPGSVISPAWANQSLRLYHGTVDAHVPSILSRVDPSRGRPTTDFGQGFYTTTVLRQAEAWAWQLSQRPAHRGSLPAVIQFDVDRDQLSQLEVLSFVRGAFDADDFWSLIGRCRRGGDHARAPNHGWYDMVIGPVAASWKQRLAIYDADQVSFHTGRAAALLQTSAPTRIR